MAKLYFKVASDWEEVVRLRNEIAKLKSELKGMDSTQTPHAFNTLNAQLQQSTQRMDELVREAAQAGAEMEQGFKKKIFDASQVVNGFTQKIIEQKAVVKDVEADVRRLGEAYRTAKKNNPWGADSHLSEYNAARKALEEEKAALFGLTQEQAKARLSVKSLRDEYALFKKEGGEVKDSIGDIAKSMKGWMAGIVGGIGVKEFIGKMIEVRGQFQAADTAIQTLLGSKEKADKLMAEVREYAKISPLEFSDVTAATQMMLGFNIEAEKVPKFLAAIGDVSMGNTQKFNSLTLAFSQMSAAGKLMGQDLNQMINAGFNPLQQIAQTTGKSIAQLKDEMSKGAISAEMVQQAFIDATSAGGKFYNMSENASKAIQGQMSMLQDAIDLAFNEMGEKSEGFIMGAIQGTTALVQNYQTIGMIIAGLVEAYGVYRAAVIVNIALTRGWAVAARADAVAKGIQTIATNAATAATKALNAAMMGNPYALVAAAVVGLTYVIYKAVTAESAEEYAVRKTNEAWDEYMKKQKERQDNIESLIRTIQSETASEYQKVEAYSKLSQLVPQLTDKYDQAAIASKDFGEAQKEVSETLENERYEELSKQVENFKQKIAEAKTEMDKLSDGSSEASEKKGYEIRIENYKIQLNEVIKKLAEMDTIRQKIADESKPIEVRIEEAKENEAVRQSIFDFYDEAMLLTKQFQDGNEDINYSTGQSRLDEFIQNAQVELEDLRKQQEENPMDLNLRLEESEKTKILNSVIAMKNNWYSSGATTVWLSFMADYGSAQRALGDAKKHVASLVGNGGGETYGDAYSKAQKDYNAKKKKLADIRKNRSKYSVADYKAAVDEEKKAKKVFQDLGGDVNGKAAKAAASAAKRQAHAAETAAKKAENERKKRLEAEKRANEELLSLQRENQEKQLSLEKETTEKKINEINLSYDKQIDAIKKKQTELAENNKKAATKGLNANGLTDKQQKEIDKATKLAGDERDQQKTDIYKDEMQAMRDYLKEYGTFQQRKFAITEEYAEKIRRAQSDGEKLSLEKQQQAEIQKVEIEALKQDIDWKGLLGDFGGLFEDQLKPTLEKLKAYTKSDEFKQADINDQKTVYDLISQLQAKTSDGWKGMFKNLGDAVQGVKDAELKYEAAKQKSIKADEEYAEARKKHTVQGANGDYVDEKNGEVAAAFKKAQEAANELADAQTNLTDKNNKVSDAANRVRENMDNLVNGLQQLGSGSMSGILGGANSIAKIFGEDNLSKTIGKELAGTATKVFGKSVGDALGGEMGGEIIEGVFALLDLFEDGIENLFTSLIDTILGAVDGLLKSALSFDVPVAIGKSLVDGVGSILNTVSFGGFNSLFSADGNAKEVAETTERLTNANERLKDSIDGLKDEISSSVGINSIKSANEALEAQKQVIENQRQILDAQQGYSSAHHSNNYYWRLDDTYKNSINNWLAEYAKKNGTKASKVNSDWSSFAKLSPEEMDYIRKHDAELWSRLTDIGKYDKSEYFDAFADLAGSLEEITDSLNEVLTTTTADNVFDDFLNSLYDLADGSEDVFEDIEKGWQQMVNKMAINNIVGAKFQEQLKAWYDDLAKVNQERTEGTITDAEYKKKLDALKEQYDKYVKDAQNSINSLRDLDIVKDADKSSSEQKASGRGFETMSQDTAEELNGRFTAVAESNYRIEAATQQQTVAITELRGDMLVLMTQSQSMANIADETRTILANSYLELQEIRENTGAIVKPIKQIQKDIAEVKQNTSRL